MSATPPLPDERYEIILADPPWLYNDARTHASAGMARSAYPCLSVDELGAIPVPSIAATRSALFLWATFPKLPEALEVMGRWGFTYCTAAFTWVKTYPGRGIETHTRCDEGDEGAVYVRDPDDDNPYSADWIKPAATYYSESDLVAGLGHYTRANQEIVLLGRRGKPFPRLDRTVRQVVLAPRGRHSAKPREVHDRIVRLFGDRPRIELFARPPVPDGWACWGLEVQ